MRILYVIPTLGVGGAEAVTISLSNGMVNSGHEVSMLTEVEILDERKNQKINYFAISTGCKENFQGSFHKLVLWTIKNRKQLESFDVIHCHLNRGMLVGVILDFILPRKRPAIIATCHSVGGNISKLRILFEKFCALRFNAFVLMAENENWTKFILKHKQKSFLVIRNGISSIAPLPKKNPDLAQQLVIGTMSRLSGDRKPHLFLDLFEEISKYHQEIKFVIGGDGPLKSELIKKAEQLKPISIEWAGEIHDKPSFFQKLDTYITLNVGNTTGIAGLEAVSAGLPVFGIQLDEDFVPSVEDFIRSSTNLKSLAQEIISIISKDSEVNSLIKSQKIYFERYFTLQIMLDHYEKLYLSQI